MSPQAAAEIEEIAGQLARMPLVHRRRPELPHEIRSELVQRLRALARSVHIVPRPPARLLSPRR